MQGERARQRDEPYRRHWTVLGIVFFYISLDEAVQLHEHMSEWWSYGGVLYFSWVLPAATFVILLGYLYLPFLNHLSPSTRRRFVTAAVLYVGGALVMELPLGWWTEQHGSDNLTYAMIDLVEETLGFAGVSVFLHALVRELAQRLEGSAPVKPAGVRSLPA